MSESYDFIVVGSGPSGGRIVKRLVESGARVALLEAGARYTPKTFPSNEMESSSQLFWGGGVEFSADARMGFLRGKGLGGTSIVNQALLDRFDDDAFEAWKSQSGIEFFNEEAVTPYYEQVESSISLQKFSSRDMNANGRLFCEALDKKGYKWNYLRRGQTDCALDRGTDCIRCLGGCPRESKQSSLVASIQPAEQMGLQTYTGCEVLEVSHGRDGVALKTLHNGRVETFRAGKVVLAAGSLGTTKILLNSGFKAKLPALGKNFACHPQFMTYGLFAEEIDAHRGAFQTVKGDDPGLRKLGLKLENVYAPPIGTAMLLPGLGRAHMKLMRSYRFMSSMEVALRDDASGEIDVDSKGRLRIKKSLTPDDRKKAKEGLGIVKDLFRSVRAQEVIQSREAFGLHLMGGAAMGKDSSQSVTNPRFELHDHPRILIADSSVFPNAPGINPSLTIMALSEMAADTWLGVKSVCPTTH